MSTSAMFG